MYVSFYENQEAAESCYTFLFFLGLASGWVLTAAFFFVMALNCEEEERLFEEMLLDSSEPTLYFTLGVQKEKFIEHYSRLGSLYTTHSRFVHAHIAEDVSYENTLVSEIYEFPISTIMSNNFYHVPQDERHLLRLLGLTMRRALDRKGTRFHRVSRSNFSTRRRAHAEDPSTLRRGLALWAPQPKAREPGEAEAEAEADAELLQTLKAYLIESRWPVFDDDVSLGGLRSFVGDLPDFSDLIVPLILLENLEEDEEEPHFLLRSKA